MLYLYWVFWTLITYFDDVYIYMYVCVCVCVCFAIINMIAIK